MGHSGLFPFLKTNAPGAQKPFVEREWTNKVVAVEIFSILYASLCSKVEQGMEMTENEQGQIKWTYNVNKNTGHLTGTFRKFAAMIALGWKPIVVFDGPPPPQKKSEHDARDARKKQALLDFQKAQQDGKYEEMLKYASSMITVTSMHVQQVKELIQAMGIPWVDAPHEGESQCAVMCRDGIADAVLSEDSDVLVFGAPVLIRNVTVGPCLVLENIKQQQNTTTTTTTTTSKWLQSRPPTIVNLKQALLELGLNVDEFRDLCMLIGCDYTPEMGGKIDGIGPAKGYKLIKEHKSIEAIIMFLLQSKSTSYTIPPTWLIPGKLNEYRKWFSQPVVKPLSKTDFEWKPIDDAALVRILVDQYATMTLDQLKNSILHIKANNI